MRVRVLRAKLYAYALPGSTARDSTRQLFNSSTLLDSSTARQNSTDLDRPRQTSTDLDAQAHAVRLDGLDSYLTAPLPRLDRARGLDTIAPKVDTRRQYARPSGPRLETRQLDSQGSIYEHELRGGCWLLRCTRVPLSIVILIDGGRGAAGRRARGSRHGRPGAPKRSPVCAHTAQEQDRPHDPC